MIRQALLVSCLLMALAFSLLIFTLISSGCVQFCALIALSSVAVVRGDDSFDDSDVVVLTAENFDDIVKGTTARCSNAASTYSRPLTCMHRFASQARS